MSKPNIETLLCECGSCDHIILFLYEDGKDWDCVYMNVHLRKHAFWKRLKYGIRYIFGYQSRYGAFDEIILRKEDWPKLQRVADKLKKG